MTGGEFFPRTSSNLIDYASGAIIKLVACATALNLTFAANVRPRRPWLWAPQRVLVTETPNSGVSVTFGVGFRLRGRGKKGEPDSPKTLGWFSVRLPLDFQFLCSH